jgi:hypothetical protein
MIVDESLENAERTLTHIQAGGYGDPAMALVVCPAWFAEAVAKAWGADDGDVPAEIHGMAVVLKADIQEPFVVAATGRLFPMLPGWARAANLGRAE